jgi:hypothetical protein
MKNSLLVLDVSQWELFSPLSRAYFLWYFAMDARSEIYFRVSLARKPHSLPSSKQKEMNHAAIATLLYGHHGHSFRKMWRYGLISHPDDIEVETSETKGANRIMTMMIKCLGLGASSRLRRIMTMMIDSTTIIDWSIVIKMQLAIRHTNLNFK